MYRQYPSKGWLSNNQSWQSCAVVLRICDRFRHCKTKRTKHNVFTTWAISFIWQQHSEFAFNDIQVETKRPVVWVVGHANAHKINNFGFCFERDVLCCGCVSIKIMINAFMCIWIIGDGYMLCCILYVSIVCIYHCVCSLMSHERGHKWKSLLVKWSYVDTISFTRILSANGRYLNSVLSYRFGWKWYREKTWRVN